MIKEYLYEGKTVEEAIEKGVEALKVDRETIEYEIIEREKKGILGIGSKPAKVLFRIEIKEERKPQPKKENKAERKVSEPVIKKAPAREPTEEESDVINSAKNFLDGIFSKMGISAEYETSVIEGEIFINIVSSDKGFIIGRRGETLDALQYLTMLTVNRKIDGHFKISLDTANYREERIKTLEGLARKLAAKAKKNRRNVSLEPMNAYERKIIHSALQNDKSISTYSVGEEPNRKVVISCRPRKD